MDVVPVGALIIHNSKAVLTLRIKLLHPSVAVGSRRCTRACDREALAMMWFYILAPSLDSAADVHIGLSRFVDPVKPD